MSPPTLGISSR